ncbi:MAG: FG-GAP-like repeat-containing protein [Chitinophagales bacterium]
MNYKIVSLSVLLFVVPRFLSAQAFYDGPGWTQHGNLAVSAFGWSMSNAGDVNGDGYDDLLVSAIDHSEPIETEEEEGKLYLFYGSPDGLDTIPAWTYQPNETLTITGFSTDGGDLNGDGYSDIIAGCLQWTGAATDEGKAILFYGGPDGPADEPDWQFSQGQEGALVGSGVALSGDINSDGFNDLFIGSKMWDGGNIDEGKTWMFYGSADGPVESGWTWEAEQDSAISGYPISYAGDVNGDGYDDVIIGANQYNNTLEDDGLAVCFYGSAAGLSSLPNWQMTEGQKKSNFGHWVDGAGDVNGDGYDDVLIAALLYEYTIDNFNEGAIFVYHGGPTGISNTSAWSKGSGQIEAQLGYCTAGTGDINGDGYDDVIAGAKYWTNGEAEEGAAFIAFGGEGGLETDWCWTGEGNQAQGFYGRHVGGDGDYNGDGYSDFLVGAYRYTDVLSQDGKGFCYYGAPRPEEFHYEKDSFCITDGFVSAIIDGISGGTFSSTSDDVVFSNVSIGEIDLAATNIGSFTIFYTLPEGCVVISQVIHIGTEPYGTFGYDDDHFPQTAPNQFPGFAGGAISGIFSATPPGLVITATTGEVNCAASTPGTYIIMNTVDNNYCTRVDSFTLTIDPPCVAPQAPYIADVSTTYVTLFWNTVPYAETYTIQVQSDVDTFLVYDHPDTTITLTGLTPYTNYRAWIVTNCGTGSSPKSEKTDFQTNPNAVENIFSENLFCINPNPANDKTIIQFHAASTQESVLQILNAEGRILFEANIKPGIRETELNLTSLSQGIYFVKCYTVNGVGVRKLVVG